MPVRPKAKPKEPLSKRFMKEVNTGPVETVKVRATRVLDSALPVKRCNGKNLESAQPGEVKVNNTGGVRGRSMLNEIRTILKERCELELKDGKKVVSTRFHMAAEAFVSKMEAGEFPFFKEFLEREEGKVPTRVAGHDGGPIKMYAAVAVDGPKSP